MKWLFSIGMVLLLFSCNKKETLKISVKNVVTGEPVAGNNISIVEIFKVSDGVSGSKTKDFYSGQTNSEGVLFITEKFNKNRRYTVKVGKFTEDVCYINKSNEQWYVGANTEISFEYAPCAYLKLKIENVDCMGSDDQIFYRRQWLHGENYSNGVTQYGCFYFDGDYFSVPMGNHKYEWIVTKNGITSNFDTTFYISEGGFYDLEIDY